MAKKQDKKRDTEQQIAELLEQSGLSDRQQKFVLEYSIDYNASKAVVRAGYSENGSTCQGSRMLSNASITRCVSQIKTIRVMAMGFGEKDLLAYRIKNVNDQELAAQDRDRSAAALERIWGLNKDTVDVTLTGLPERLANARNRTK